jgi:hypothetical protein
MKTELKRLLDALPVDVCALIGSHRYAQEQYDELKDGKNHPLMDTGLTREEVIQKVVSSMRDAENSLMWRMRQLTEENN